MIEFGVHTAATAGTLRAIGFLDADPPTWDIGADEVVATNIVALTGVIR